MHRASAAAAAILVLLGLSACGGGKTAAAPSTSTVTLTLQDKQAAGACADANKVDTAPSELMAQEDWDAAVTYANEAAQDPKYQDLGAQIQTAHDDYIPAKIDEGTAPADYKTALAAVMADCIAVPVVPNLSQ